MASLLWFSLPLLYLAWSYFGRSKTPRSCKYPPGPPGKWLVGNILKVSPQGAWDDFLRYKEQYGDLVHFHGLGNHILVLNSLKAINDLLDKRGNIYSHRPVFTVVSELMGLGQSMPLLPYGSEWREHRKLAHLVLSQSAVKRIHGVQQDMAALLNEALLDKPDDFFSHVRLTAGRIILSVTYGLSVETVDNEYISHAEETMDVIGRATVPGAFLCDMLPVMKHLPSWLPFQRQAAIGREMIDRLVTLPFEHVKTDMANGKEGKSLTAELLRASNESDGSYEHQVKWTAGALYGAAGESTYATVLTFIMAMALNPEKQNLAQSEIDRIIGPNRLPCMDDIASLPYTNALIKETMRWHPALPLGIARMTAEDDVYDNFFVPKGTIVIPNVWAIAFEENSKYDPSCFIPERFLDPNDLTVEPRSWAFGFGRRICPGRYMGENSIFILISNILASFTISPPDPGEDKALVPRFGRNLVSYPEPFHCKIVPRSTEHSKLVKSRANQTGIHSG